MTRPTSWIAATTRAITMSGMLLCLLGSGAAVAAACGNIVTLEGVSEPITDCANPFGVTSNRQPSLFINAIPVADGEMVTMFGDETTVVTLRAPENVFAFTVDGLYRHERDDFAAELFTEVTDTPPPTVGTGLPLSPEDERQALREFLTDGQSLRPYDPVLETGQRERVLTEDEDALFSDFVNQYEIALNDDRYTNLTPGTYTLVVSFEAPQLMQRQELRWLTQLKHVLITTAHAQAVSRDVATLTFTVEQIPLPEEPTEPGETAGPSSVLFLPGIQASRLYTTEPDGTEKLLWEPNSVFEDGDVLRLAMTEAGESIADVYVRDVIDYAPPSGNPADAIYGGFLQFLEELVATEAISDYEAFAYDWRYDVYDIVEDGVQYENGRRSLLAAVENLAEVSASGKVTIVAHSNGGLLGKALLEKLADTNRLHQVDAFIMIGTPQLGTPKAIGSLLHGTDQGLSFKLFDRFPIPIISDAAVREAARNMPGAYGLLPGTAYFDVANDIVTIFDTSEITTPWRTAYGNTLNSQAELDDFLLSPVNNRAAVTYNSTNEAIVANETILNQARVTRARQDSWQAPAGVAVSSIVGTGRNTISGFSYEAFTDQMCDGGIGGCNIVDIYKPVPIISQRGDQTVMVASAAGVDNGTDVFYVDIGALRSIERDNLQHSNFTESPTVQSLVSSLLQATSTDQAFVSTTEPNYADQQLLLGTHSPVYLSITDSSGRVTGQIDADTVLTEIPETEWFTHASSSYIVAPEDADFTVRMQSFGSGVVTFTSHEVTAEGQSLAHKVPVPNLGTDTRITIEYADTSFTPLAIDEDGDGTVDYQLDLSGERIDVPDEVVTYATVRQYLKDNVHRRIARPLRKLLRVAERLSKESGPYAAAAEQFILHKFEKTLIWLHRKNRLSAADYEVLLSYVEQLKE